MIKRFLPVILLFILIGISYYMGITQYVTWETLRKQEAFLKEAASQHFVFTSLIFVLTFFVYTALCLPGLFVLSILAGYLFQQPFSTLYVALAVTAGSTLLFLVARSAFGEGLKLKASPFFNSMESYFSKNATFYLVMIRMIPLFPPWMISVAFAFFNVRFKSFLWTTFFGVLPIVFLYTQIGSGLTTILNQKIPLSWDLFWIPKIGLSLIGLMIFCILPLCYKQLCKSK